VLLTHDLDFGVILAMTRARGPSVVQMRAQDLMPDAVEEIVLRVLRDCASDLERGALVSVDPYAARIRILPLQTSPA
jgi:predicted nuclease of predicted toxin-antitoxin system